MQRTSARLFEITGKISVEDVAKKSGQEWKTGINKAVLGLRSRYPRATTAEFNGDQSHKSSKDPSDPKEVVTLAMFSERGTRLGSAHIHEDGTFNDFPSRAGKASVQKANNPSCATSPSDSGSKK